MKGTAKDLKKMKWREAAGQPMPPLPNRAGLLRNKVARAPGPTCFLTSLRGRAWCSDGLFLGPRASLAPSQSPQGSDPLLSPALSF